MASIHIGGAQDRSQNATSNYFVDLGKGPQTLSAIHQTLHATPLWGCFCWGIEGYIGLHPGAQVCKQSLSGALASVNGSLLKP